MSIVTNLKFKDEDGGDELETIVSINIEVADNGYIVFYSFEDTECKEVYEYENKEDLIKSLRYNLGM